VDECNDAPPACKESVPVGALRGIQQTGAAEARPGAISDQAQLTPQ